jgi:hypothetical protein
MDVKAQAKDIETGRSELEDNQKLFIVHQGDSRGCLGRTEMRMLQRVMQVH